MMWNFLVGCLLTDAAIVLFDGNPGHPDMDVLWDLAERAGVTCFGTSASFISASMKAGVRLATDVTCRGCAASAPRAPRSPPMVFSGSPMSSASGHGCSR